MSTSAWYVVETKRHREQVAGAFLAQDGIASYLPRIAQWPRPAVGAEVAPLFPGYLFVRVALERQYQRVTRMVGVKTFVSFGGLPVPLTDETIDTLRRREGPDGLIRYDAGVEATEVEVIDGPFRGLTAVVERRLTARDRVRVLMHMLQREAAVELPGKWLRPV
jgi:transcriptional antiterminator RfaH